mgnify:CR=1 FL=1
MEIQCVCSKFIHSFLIFIMFSIRCGYLFQIIRYSKFTRINQFCSTFTDPHSGHEKSKKNLREKVQQKIAEIDAEQLQSPNTPLGLMNRSPHVDPNSVLDVETQSPNPAYDPFPDNKNPKTGEINGPTGPEPTRYGDWERKGRCSDF